jgi:hypothetical protein
MAAEAPGDVVITFRPAQAQDAVRIAAALARRGLEVATYDASSKPPARRFRVLLALPSESGTSVIRQSLMTADGLVMEARPDEPDDALVERVAAMSRPSPRAASTGPRR